MVALGGGHGLAASLSALRRVTGDLTAIVTVADNGGSSGRLRSEFGALPPGDLRMALAALCGDDEWGTTWASVVQHRFGGDSVTGLRLNIVSFGYKYGLPVDADLVADCRFLPNPHWVPELRPLSGLDASVRDYVLDQPAASAFLAAYLAVLEVSLSGFEREGKRYVTLAVGCTGGKHRSVAMAEQLAARLAGRDVTVSHRDLGRE